MKTKLVLAIGLLTLTSVVSASEFVCKVYCNSGETYVTLDASSASDAAAKVDKQSDQICKGDKKGNSSSKTMRPEQCSRK